MFFRATRRFQLLQTRIFHSAYDMSECFAVHPDVFRVAGLSDFRDGNSLDSGVVKTRYIERGHHDSDKKESIIQQNIIKNNKNSQTKFENTLKRFEVTGNESQK